MGSDTRDRILAATLTIIGQEGIDGVTHRRVAAEAGVGLGSTTRHFATRDDMIREAFIAHMDSVQSGALALKHATADVDTPDGLAAVVAAWAFGFDTDVTAAEYELLVVAHRDPQLAERIALWHAVLDGVLVEILEGLGVSRPLAGARAMRAILRGSELERLSTGDVTEQETADRLAAVLNGLILSPTDST